MNINKREELAVLWRKSFATVLIGLGHPWTKADKELFAFILEKLVKILISRGPKDAIRVSKLGRASLLSSLKDTSDNPCLSRFTEEWAYLNGKIDHDSSDKIRMVMTLFTLSRSIYLEPEVSMESIQSPFKGALEELHEYIPGFWASIGHPTSFSKAKKTKWYPRWKDFTFTAKKGPNGPAFETLLWDLVSLSTKQVNSIKLLGGIKFSKVVDMWLYFMKYIPYSFPSLQTRRLAAISDKEGKTREIAIFDYWSQNALKGLHDYMFKLLKRIPQDCTFDQNKFKTLLDNSNVNEFNSIDLEKATDRFPIKLISEVLRFNLGVQRIDEWEYLMVGEPFKISCGKITHEVSYMTGNPMGALSSWSTFALCHHFVVYCSCVRTGKDWSKLSYALLGDDIVINDNVVAEEYLKILSYLDVHVSLTKTHKSSTLYEFAKRYMYKGVEISPFPINAMVTNHNNPGYLISDLLFVDTRGFKLNNIPAFILQFLGRLGWNAKRRNKVKPNLNLAANFSLLRWGLVPLRSVLEPIIGPKSLHYEPFNGLNDDERDYVAFQALRVALQELLVTKELWAYNDEYPTDTPSISFGASALRDMLSWYDLFLKYRADTGYDVDISSSMPLMSVTKSLQEEMMEKHVRLVACARDMTKIDWAPLLDMMLITASDTTFSIQKKHISSEVSSRLRGGLNNYLQLISENYLWTEFKGSKLNETEKFLFE